MATLRPVSRIGDITTGHQCYAPSKGITSSPNVFADGRLVHCVGDTFSPHTCGNDVHADVLVGGSAKVFANGRPIARLGDALAPGGALMAESSWTVFAAG
tara:strand:- start:488 stop:787 length:300 start_codon:yes stop_codon:yes gene_type:complete